MNQKLSVRLLIPAAPTLILWMVGIPWVYGEDSAAPVQLLM